MLIALTSEYFEFEKVLEYIKSAQDYPDKNVEFYYK